MELAEFVIKIIIIATLAVGILGFTLQSASFEGRVVSYDKERLAIDLAQAFASAPCFGVDINGDLHKGLLDSEKLSEQMDLPVSCIDLPGSWGAEISTSERIWTFGPLDGIPQTTSEFSVTRAITAAVKLGEGNVVPATIRVRVQ
jgi:hypothetical protein